MPGNYQFSVDQLTREVKEIATLGIPAVLLFGIPEHKDAHGSEAYAKDGIIQQAVQAIKDSVSDLLVITDTCLCEYTSHGHCGVVEKGIVKNDPTLELLAKAAVSQAEAGADIVAPSDMMDGRVASIREALDTSGFEEVAIMSYAAKYASAFYGPFRVAAESAPQFGGSAELSDGYGKRRGGLTRGRHGHRGGGRYRHGEACPGIPGRPMAGPDRV